jgi:hypothetical protein
MDTHLDVTLRQDARSTWERCDLVNLRTREEKNKIESVRIQCGSGSVRRGRRRGLFERGGARIMPQHEMIQVFRSLSGDLPSLERLRIRFKGTGLPMRAVTESLLNSKKLTSLRVFDVQFKRIAPDDLQGLAYACRSHPSLRRVFLDLCQVSAEEQQSKNSSESLSLEPIIHALCQNSNVQKIAISNTKISLPNDIVGTSSWIRALAQSPTLTSLKLEMVEEILNEHIILLAQTLAASEENIASESNTASPLQDLCIESCKIKESGCAAMAQFLKTTRHLERLDFVLYDNSSMSKDGELPKEIDWNNAGMAEACLHNTTLKYLRLFSENITKNGYPDAFVSMLRTNCTLEHLVLGWDGEACAESSFYLQLNRDGRRHLTEQAPKVVWVDFMIQHSDLSSIFYVLTRNPSLVKEMKMT